VLGALPACSRAQIQHDGNVTVVYGSGMRGIGMVLSLFRSPLKAPGPHCVSNLVREEEGAGPGEPRVLIVPVKCTVNDDHTFEVPSSWELDHEWGFRNDIQDIVEHNVGVQLAKAEMIESSGGTLTTGSYAMMVAAHAMLQPADLYQRVNMISWGRAKTFGAVMLLVRSALNMYSVITNVTSLDEGVDKSYTTVRKIVFYFELIVVCIMLALSVLHLLSSLWAKYSWSKYDGGKKLDVFTGKPFKPGYRSLRAQVCVRVQSAKPDVLACWHPVVLLSRPSH
jgi:hypothetical protein